MVAMLAGCQTGQEHVKQDPKAALGRCLSRMETTNISAKHELASFMGVSMERMPALFCQRLLNAALSGRLSLSDINRLQLDQPTEVWKIIKGK
ncbi:MAG: hypothetical protein ABJB10_10525 [Mesorhizobium sp.]